MTYLLIIIALLGPGHYPGVEEVEQVIPVKDLDSCVEMQKMGMAAANKKGQGKLFICSPYPKATKQEGSRPV